MIDLTEDFQKSLDLVTQYVKYKDNIGVKVGKTLRILDNTPLTDENFFEDRLKK